MSISDAIDQDLTQAMKAKQQDKVSVLRMVKAAFMNYKIEKKREKLEDPEALEILQRQVKQRKESLESFQKAGRTDLAQKEEKELGILQTYLPKQLSDAEIIQLVQKAVQTTGVKVKADAGRVMKELMPAVKGRADGKRINDIVIGLLS